MKRIFTICFLFCVMQVHLRAQDRGSYQPNSSELDVFIENNNTYLFDKTVVAFNNGATNSFDNQYDANKIPGSLNRETLYTVNNGQWMSINTLNSVSSVPTVPMGLEPGGTGNFVLSFEGDSTFDNTSYIMLEDLQANVWHDVRSGSYEFWADSAENWNRFILHFTPPAIIASTNATCDNMGVINVVQPGPAYWHYVIQDASNNTIVAGLLNENSPLTANVQPGIYTLTLTDTNNYVAVKTIAVGGVPTVIASFTMSSSEVPVQTPVAFSSTSVNAQNYTWDFGDGSGTSTDANPTHTYTAPGIYTVTLTVTNGLGCSSTFVQRVTVGNTTTGISDLSTNNLSVWSHSESVYVDFSRSANVDAVIKIYDILGREISSEKFAKSAIYQKQLTSLDAAYVIVSVLNGNKITNKKVFISNGK